MMVEAFQQASKDPMFWANRLAYGPDQVRKHNGEKLLIRLAYKWTRPGNDGNQDNRLPHGIIILILTLDHVKHLDHHQDKNQGFLKRYLWPWGKWSAVSHDSYSCQVSS